MGFLSFSTLRDDAKIDSKDVATRGSRDKRRRENREGGRGNDSGEKGRYISSSLHLHDAQPERVASVTTSTFPSFPPCPPAAPSPFSILRQRANPMGTRAPKWLGRRLVNALWKDYKAARDCILPIWSTGKDDAIIVQGDGWQASMAKSHT